MSAPVILPTLPTFPGIDDLRDDRAELVAGLAFVEGACTFSRTDLRDWFREHAVALGRQAEPVSVRDTLGGSTPLPLDGPPHVRHEELPPRAVPPDATCTTVPEVGRILLQPASVS